MNRSAANTGNRIQEAANNGLKGELPGTTKTYAAVPVVREVPVAIRTANVPLVSRPASSPPHARMTSFASVTRRVSVRTSPFGRTPLPRRCPPDRRPTAPELPATASRPAGRCRPESAEAIVSEGGRPARPREGPNRTGTLRPRDGCRETNGRRAAKRQAPPRWEAWERSGADRGMRTLWIALHYGPKARL